MKTTLNIRYGSESEAQVLDLYLPEGEVSAVLVYFHGGGIEFGDKADAIPFAPYLAERGIAVVSANYRMYPDAEYPDFIYDAARAVAFTHGMKGELGCERIYVGGSSAGGYISMMLCFDGRYLASVGLDNSIIAGYYHDAGQPTAHFNVLKYRGIDPRRVIVDESAPLYHINADQNYPPMRFVVSDNDIPSRYEQTMLVLSTLAGFGYTEFDHLLMHGDHVAYCKQIGEDGESVFGRMICDFIRKCERD